MSLDKESQSISLTANELALHKGDQIGGAYIVISGRLRVLSYTASGSEYTHYYVNQGETCVFAINSLFKNLRYPAWVAADINTQIIVIRGDTYRRLFREEPGIQDLTIQALSSAVEHLINEVDQLQGWNLKQRLIHFLLSSASHEGIIALTQQQIANHLGTTREMVARLLGELGSLTLLSTQRGRIILKDSRRLTTFLER